MDTFCVLPWLSREIDWNQKETPCCLLPVNHDLNSIKNDMLAGRKPPECQKCWNLEDRGLKSDRMLKNETLDFYWNRDLEAIKQDCINDKNQTVILKLTSSYTCNATCVTCDASASSSWGQLARQADLPYKGPSSYKFIDIDQIKETVDFKQLRMLSLLGGEPLYEKKNFELLEHLLEVGNNTVFLSMITNGSVRLTQHQKNILTKFKNINFSVSIDGTESVFEYVRFPLKWSMLTENINFFRTFTDNISSNYTLNNLNILYHNQTVEWFNQNNIVYSVNPVYTPLYFSPKALSVHVKQILKSELTANDYNTFIGPIHTDIDQTNFENFLLQIKQQDLAKQISMHSYLPRLAELLDY